MNDFFITASVSLVLWAASFIYFRTYLSKRTSAQRVLGELRDEVEKLVSEVDLATDRDVTLVEDRIKALKALLEEADKRIAVLKREAERRGAEDKALSDLGRRNAEDRAYADLGRRATALRLDAAPRPTPAPTLFPEPADSSASVAAPEPAEGEAAQERARPASRDAAAYKAPAPSPAGAPAPAGVPGVDYSLGGSYAVPPRAEEAGTVQPRFARSAQALEPKAAPLFERVAELARAGFSAELIASRLGATVGEVELAISLSGQREGRDGDDTGN